MNMIGTQADLIAAYYDLPDEPPHNGDAEYTEMLNELIVHLEQANLDYGISQLDSSRDKGDLWTSKFAAAVNSDPGSIQLLPESVADLTAEVISLARQAKDGDVEARRTLKSAVYDYISKVF